jgi:hypothetical protein
LRYEFCGSQGYIECNECGTQGPCDERAADPICDLDAACDAWNRRAALAQPEPQGPTDEEPTDQEIEEWADAAAEVPLEEMDPEVHGWRRCFKSDEFSETIRAALARWGRPAIEPVPVSERLPGPEDCDAEGRCWLCGNVEGDWRLLNPANTGVPQLKYCFSHWLPYWALPVPVVEGANG